MSKKKKRSTQPPDVVRSPQASIPRASSEDHVHSRSAMTWLLGLGALCLVALAIFAAYPAIQAKRAARASKESIGPSTPAPIPGQLADSTNVATMEVAKAVMVTSDLDFGPQLPAIADALKEIERRYEPEDGSGRTFAILDAYGEPSPEGKLRLSMHVSTEKPGKGAIVFKRTGAVLWQSRIVPATNKASNFSGKNLLILVDNGDGKLLTVDGSNNPTTVLDANIKEAGIPLRDLWLDQTEREVTFMYSACGCPVKVQTRRDGERTVRTKDQPVIFPDDPAVVGVIEKVMAW